MNSPATEDPTRYAERPCYPELAAVVAVGSFHVLTELGASPTIARIYNAVAVLAFAVYALWRVRRTPGVLRAWGMRADNLRSALWAQLTFVVAGGGAMFAFGAAFGSGAVPSTFWATVALYPAWGLAQQFALQNFVTKNLTGAIGSPVLLAVVAASLFAVSHYPRLELVALTFVAGVFLTLIYRSFPNLWAAGLAHGFLGSLAFYLVLGEDPGAAILAFVLGG